MKPNSKVFEHIAKHNYYLPSNLEQVQIIFYEQIVSNLGLQECFKNSFVSQISKLNAFSNNEQDFKQLMKNAWVSFLNQVEIHKISPMNNLQEQNEIKEFILRVLTEPRQYELTYVDELLQVYENYFQSNKGVACVVQRNRFRMVISKLICSRYILKQPEKIQQRVRTFLFDVFLKKLEKKDSSVPISTDLFSDSDMLTRVFEFLFESQNDGNVYGIIKQIIVIIVKDFQTSNLPMALDLITQFFQMCQSQDKILSERIEGKTINQGLISEFQHKYREREDIRDAVKYVHSKLTQTTNYKLLLKELITKDLYAKENEQTFCPFFQEVDKYYKDYTQRTRKQYPESELSSQLKQIGFQRNERGEYENKSYIIQEIDKEIIMSKKDGRQRKKVKDIKEVLQIIQTGQF